MLNWSQQFGILLFLDSNCYPSLHGRYECLLAAGELPVVAESPDALYRAWRQSPDWYFGHIAYEYKDVLEPRLHSRHPQQLGYPLFRFFVPETVLSVNAAGDELTIACATGAPESVYKALNSCRIQPLTDLPALSFIRRVEQEPYLQTIEQLRAHIAAGDCYEINYCTEGYAEDVSVVPVDIFRTLNSLSPAPFAAFYRLHELWMMCSSPERYLMKEGRRLLSQPIKGTARRMADAQADVQAREALYNSIKERAENVMITDLVRNDLSRSCLTGSIQVDELFGIYSFPQVHQMVSTVSGTLKDDQPFTDAIRYSFPMGSMTGAPKVKVMELVDRYEQSRRELFSGTVGYLNPEGDFDFNVVIRSLFYNAATRYLSYHTGGAITYDSSPQQEWEEMRLKAWALEKIFHP